MSEPKVKEKLMIYVMCMSSCGPDRFPQHHKWISADMSCPLPDPPLSNDEMQPVVYAAKMALAKILRKRKRMTK